MAKDPIFVVHEHDATRLHWDLRLQKGRVMPSWAITKKPPLSAGTKRLAIETEDHSLSYAKFEGEIPKGQYGAGTVKIWDDGTFELVKWEPKEIIVRFKGKKLKGEYVLIKFEKAGPKNWLFFKKK